MKLKKWLVFLIFTLICFNVFAEDSYKLSVTSADNMTVGEKLVTLEGRVKVSFSTNENESTKTRELRADKVIIDIDRKELDALGNVYLTEGKDSTFQGDSLSLNWDTLDIVVFGGTSTSDRKGMQGNNVKFYTVGNRISYAGKTDAIFFQDGVIATRASNPYWSIKAKKIGLAGSDIFFSNATLKLGRVPIFWLPVFFYPGNRLSFNPAIGFSSNKGAFLNTTYELYGSYPGLGASTSNVDDSDTSALTGNFLSFLNADTGEKMVRSGWSYVKAEEAGEMSELRKWAVETNSYFAIFADVWENYGFSLGFDTKNNLLNNNLKLSSTAVVGYKNHDKFRYSFEITADYKINNTSFNFSAPFMSDPDVKYDLLNRNTVFGLDAALGAEQKFPVTYNDGLTSKSIILNGSTTLNLGKYSIKFPSIKAQINYGWNSGNKKYDIKDAILPYISLNSSGTLVDIKGKETSREEIIDFNNSSAQYFFDSYESIKDSEAEEKQSNNFDGIDGYKGAAVSNVKSVVTPAGSFKMDYTYNQVVDNDYSNKFEHTSFFTKINTTISLSGGVPGQWFSFSETFNPVLNTTQKEKDNDSTDFKLLSTLKSSVPKLSLSYTLKSYVYLFEKTPSADVDRWGKWDKTDVLEHALSFSKKLFDFTVGLKYILPPLNQTFTPNVGYSHNGFTSAFDCSFVLKDKEKVFKASVMNANFGYSKTYFNLSLNNKYDFEKKDYTGTQSGVLYLMDKKLKLSESITLTKDFKIKAVVVGADYNKNYIKLSFKDKDIKPDKLNIYLYDNVDAFYFWKDRIGFEANYDLGFIYDFQNKYNSSLYADISGTFAINKFLDITFSVKSVNNSFYRYYDIDSSNNEHFKFSYLFKDLINSFDFFGSGRTHTGFNLNALSVSAVHYMEDWTLTLNASSKIKTVNGKNKFVPEFSFLIKWDAIPELKSTNSWDKNAGWDKK